MMAYREFQIFLASYILVSICEIFTIGGFPLSSKIRIVRRSLTLPHPLYTMFNADLNVKAFTGIHLGAIVASLWILLLNALVCYQLQDDGTPRSIFLLLGSAAVLFIGTGYIALDTGYSWTGYFDSSVVGNQRNIALYVLYQLAPLVFLSYFSHSKPI